MAGTTKASTTFKRHGILLGSSSRQFDSRSKQDTGANSRGTFGSQNTHNSTRPGNTHNVQGTAGAVPDRQDAGKLTVLSPVPSITPQVSPRLRRKGCPEKENIKVDGPPLRQTISRSASCNALLRKPVFNANSDASSVRIKTPHSLPRSESSRPSKLPRSPNSRLHLQALTSSHERAMKRSQTTFSFDTKVKGKDNVTTVEQQDLSGKHLQDNTTVKARSTSTQGDNSDDPAEPTAYSACVPTSDLREDACGSSKTPITPSVPRSASIPRTVSSFSRSKSLKPTQLPGISDSTERTTSVPKSPHLKTHSARQQSTVLKMPVSPSPLGNVLYSSADEEMKKMDWDTPEALDDEARFELADLGAVFQQVRAELKQASPTSSTNAEEFGDASLEELSTVAVSGTAADLCEAAPLDEMKIYQEMYSGNEADIDEKPKAHKEPESDSEDPGHAKSRPAQGTLGLPSESSGCSSCFAESIHSDAVKSSAAVADSNESIDANSEVVSTPKSSVSKSPPPNVPSAPPSTPIRSSPSPSVPQQPSALFPRIFTELASSYAQFGFSSNTNLGFGFGSATRAAKAGTGTNDQTVRTQRELARLRAGTGSVLTRARLFGQTIWSPSRAQRNDDSEVTSIPAGQENSGTGHPGEASGSEVVTPPSSPLRSTTDSSPPSDTSSTATPIKCNNGKRTLGCADALHAVAMAQQLWKTKNFLLE
ncbi:uncharacterized protein FOMMEDRAFT_150277 [Fomitiporia mediterranea MF3/22]|uniref:uncharacterized protein n=1 Tax=Fomitiporia mediterranea (strain MF3/22) TaxID=694068 RepID=UPI0004407D14|nr:uncharacterized protein FOMMEDRAFT_150277 [Fomitiporia mediterranea MF3/22]EJD07734.1 hypothetical protein FOMMEDRAFT_150277 [Fomitiporia mediterranea MF3/22]